MYKATHRHRQIVDIPFHDLQTHIADIKACLPRVKTCHEAEDGTCRIETHPIRWTPFVTMPAIGWFHTEAGEDCIHWHPKTCEQSLGCLSGKATPLDGQTFINAKVEIHIPHLPAVNPLSHTIIQRCVVAWQRKLLAEFTDNWHQMHNREV